MTWEYIAGFFDGEGSISPNGTDFRVTIPQTNLPVLNAIKAFTKIGSICQVAKRKKHWKECWTYYIAKQKDVQLFLEKVAPFLIVKREKVSEALVRLTSILSSQNKRRLKLEDRRKEAVRLRGEGLSYWKIGLAMDLDRGYVRRLIIGKWHK